jgi:hypothetical protein
VREEVVVVLDVQQRVEDAGVAQVEAGCADQPLLQIRLEAPQQADHVRLGCPAKRRAVDRLDVG